MAISTNGKIGIVLGLAAATGLIIWAATRKSGANLTSNGNTANVGNTPKGGLIDKAGQVVNTVKDIADSFAKTGKEKEYKDGLKYACGSAPIWGFSSTKERNTYDSCKLLYDENWAVISKSSSFDGEYNGATSANADGQILQVNNLFDNFGKKTPKSKETDLVYQTENVY